MRIFSVGILLSICFSYVLTVSANAGRLGVCYECRAEGIPQPYYRWSKNDHINGACGALQGSNNRAPAQLCDAAEGIVRWRGTNDPFWKCETRPANHHAWIGGENRDLVVISRTTEINDGEFYRVQDGDEYSCGGDFSSEGNVSALRYGNNRDLLYIFHMDDQRTLRSWTHRIQDGAGHAVIVGSNFVARLYGRNKDILALYGLTANGDLVHKARFINDGRFHTLRRLSATDAGLTYGRNKDINVRYCFNGSRWMTGYIRIGAAFKSNCDTVLNW